MPKENYGRVISREFWIQLADIDKVTFVTEKELDELEIETSKKKQGKVEDVEETDEENEERDYDDGEVEVEIEEGVEVDEEADKKADKKAFLPLEEALALASMNKKSALVKCILMALSGPDPIMKEHHDEMDIELVMSQANVTRGMAVKELQDLKEREKKVYTEKEMQRRQLQQAAKVTRHVNAANNIKHGRQHGASRRCPRRQQKFSQ